MMKDSISKANMDDLQEILNLQYLAYQSEAALFGNKAIGYELQKYSQLQSYESYSHNTLRISVITPSP